MKVIGIDPGLTGAVVALYDSHCYISDYRDTPTVPTGRGARRTYAPSQMAALLTEFSCGQECHVFIERQQAMRGQGIASTFSTGRGFGLWEMAAAALGYPYEVVSPATWHRAMVGGKSSEGKQRAIIAAERLFPDLKLFGPRGGAKHGRADAALIAEWGRRKLKGDRA